MKKPLTTLAELFASGLPEIPWTAATTLEFCYDHIHEENDGLNQDTTHLFDQNSKLDKD
jgi:hypothetical protein